MCIGNACTQFPCISNNVYVTYNETNDQIYEVPVGYINAMYYDGARIDRVAAESTLTPGEVRESEFHFRFGKPVRPRFSFGPPCVPRPFALRDMYTSSDPNLHISIRNATSNLLQQRTTHLPAPGDPSLSPGTAPTPAQPTWGGRPTPPAKR